MTEGRMRLALVLCFVAGCPLPKDTGDTDTGTCVPTETAVPEGVYGGAHLQLTVAADGSAELLGDCSRATTPSVPVVEGAVDWELQWQSGYGLPVQDTGSIVYTAVRLEGTFCGDRLTGTLTFEDGTTGAIDVVLGQAADLYYCE